ncbi:MAG TPA: hypothetical protein VFA75_11535 [Nevskia sp.]|nr:hypothetical protein [Nevskia sp.]
MTKVLRWGFVACVLLGFTLTAEAQTATVLTASRSGSQGSTLSGSLKTVTGSGVPFTTVYVNTVDTNARLGVATQSVQGIVPSQAVTAELGVQIGHNLIGEPDACVCNGAAAVVVGGLTYTDSGSNDNYFAKVVPTPFPYPDVGMSVQTYSLQPQDSRTQILTTEQLIAGGGSVSVGQQFRVSPGGQFTLNAPIMATANAAQAGYVFVRFLDAAGNTLPTANSLIWFTPNQNLLQSLTTDLNGNFSLNLKGHIYLGDPQIRVDFPGNGSYGLSTVTIAPVGLNTPNTLPALQQPVPVTSLGTSAAPMIWLGPLADFVGGVNGNGWSWQYNNWGPTKSQTQILRFPATWLATFGVDDLAQLVWNMNHASSPLYVELEIQANDWYYSGQPTGCTKTGCCGGGGIESYSDPGSLNSLIALLMGAGANVSIVAMDEPFYFGAVYTGNSKACPSAIRGYSAIDEANNAALLLKIYQAAFPKLIYGDVEPFPVLPDNDANWASHYQQFVQQLETNMGNGFQLSFLHTDIDLDLLLKDHGTDPSKTVSYELGLVAPVVRNSPLNMKLGVVVDSRHSDKTYASNPNQSTDQWMIDAKSYIWCIINSGVAPEQLAFESWDWVQTLTGTATIPTMTVPDNNPRALANLVSYYENRTSGTCNF